MSLNPRLVPTHLNKPHIYTSTRQLPGKMVQGGGKEPINRVKDLFKYRKPILPFISSTFTDFQVSYSPRIWFLVTKALKDKLGTKS